MVAYRGWMATNLHLHLRKNEILAYLRPLSFAYRHFSWLLCISPCPAQKWQYVLVHITYIYMHFVWYVHCTGQRAECYISVSALKYCSQSFYIIFEKKNHSFFGWIHVRFIKFIATRNSKLHADNRDDRLTGSMKNTSPTTFWLNDIWAHALNALRVLFERHRMLAADAIQF